MKTKPTFVQSYPSHAFNADDDYKEKDYHFIQCLKSLESLMDINAVIWDYKNKEILYATKSCIILMGQSLEEIKRDRLHIFLTNS